jgi:homogentisate 1,2-dioxygenase
MPSGDSAKFDPSTLKYSNGFGNHVESSAVPNGLPKLGNNPQKHPLGLYTECISGTAFTAPRHQNQRSWVYRVSNPGRCRCNFETFP